MAKDILRKLVSVYLGSLLICGVITLLVGCTHTKYIEVERVKTDSVFISIKDTIREKTFIEIERRDSVHEREYTDSLGVQHHDIEHYIYGTTNKDKEKEVITQTEYIEVKGDSIPYPVYVEKEPTRWEKAKIKAGELSMAALAALFILGGVALFLKKR